MSMTETSASFVKEALKDGSKIIVIDPIKEYEDIVKMFKGKIVTFDQKNGKRKPLL